MENSNPRVFESAEARPCHPEDELDDVHDYIDSREIFGELKISASGMQVRQRNLVCSAGVRVDPSGLVANAASENGHRQSNGLTLKKNSPQFSV